MKRTILFLLIAVFGLGTLTADAQTKKIGMKRARAIATKAAAGKIKSSELEKEDGKWIYSFDIRNAKGTITEVNIDVYSGRVISAREENAEKEAEEKRLEKKKNQ
ncbi:MAG TPA: PepSY domain-containing protein [Pyrinomonadaceae bacterium]|nr:PepSY domain-containing protein [Pyrinomonadaceae bacterium]